MNTGTNSEVDYDVPSSRPLEQLYDIPRQFTPPFTPISEPSSSAKVIKKFPLLPQSFSENTQTVTEPDEEEKSRDQQKKSLEEKQFPSPILKLQDPPPRRSASKQGNTSSNAEETVTLRKNFKSPEIVKVDTNLHYGVRNPLSGEIDFYANPGVISNKPVVQNKPHITELKYLQPPEPPQRNSSKSKPIKGDSSSKDDSNRNSNAQVMLTDKLCVRCNKGFDPTAKIVNSDGEVYHDSCFVCAQCFRPFQNNLYFEFEGRKYCEHDFHILFAPCCAKCGEFIVGRIIRAMQSKWHSKCFTCEMCHKELADSGFIKNQGRALCHECNAKVKLDSFGSYMCQKCHSAIDGEPLRFRGDIYHPYHFNCASCGVELTSTAREVTNRTGYSANDMNELYCIRCHDKMGIPICAGCRKPIEERVVTALGKNWHVDHFVCAKCEKPFMGNRHYEKKGVAYCEVHYNQLFGNPCFICNKIIEGDHIAALNKLWCVHHFVCSCCDQLLTTKSKYLEVDLLPVCKKCYEKFPGDVRKRLAKYRN